jgi:hypothetical protein
MAEVFCASGLFLEGEILFGFVFDVGESQCYKTRSSN